MARSGSTPATAAQQPKAKPAAETQPPTTSVHPAEPSREPENAQREGTSQARQRQALGKNVESHQVEPHPETAAGQHATGSFTGSGGKKS
jgi:hypothetical protein